MKQFCHGCRAYVKNKMACDLGYKTTTYGGQYVLYPVEECPKPKTWKLFNELKAKEAI